MLTPFIITSGPNKGQTEYGTNKADAEGYAEGTVRTLTAAERWEHDEEYRGEALVESGSDFGDENGSSTEYTNDLRASRTYGE